MKKILLTGSGGFIGRNIKEQLKEDYDIYSPPSSELNLLDTRAVQNYLEKNAFDEVIHAATINTTRKIVTPGECLNGNLRMYYNLRRCSALYGKMLYLGSGAEYDREHYAPEMSEDYLGEYIPKDSYGFSKYIMAKDCETSENIYELCLFGVYGKYEEWERRFISNAICRTLRGMDITLQKNVKFDYLWIDDFITILKWFVENEPKYRRYNVCRGEKIDLLSLAHMVQKALNADNRIIVGETGWKSEYTGNNARLMAELGYFQFKGFQESIEELCDYYRKVIDTIDETKLI